MDATGHGPRQEFMMDQRRENLRLLGIFHLIYAGLVVLGSLVPIGWLSLAGLWWPELAAEMDPGQELPVTITGTLLATVVGIGVLLAWIWAGILVFAGRSLMTARRYSFCLVVAAVACLSVPLGTALGVATLIVIHRQSTREVFTS
jgi:hypothetical protein